MTKKEYNRLKELSTLAARYIPEEGKRTLTVKQGIEYSLLYAKAMKEKEERKQKNGKKEL